MLTVEGMIVCLMVLSHMMRFVLVTSFIIVKENIKINNFTGAYKRVEMHFIIKRQMHFCNYCYLTFLTWFVKPSFFSYC